MFAPAFKSENAGTCHPLFTNQVHSEALYCIIDANDYDEKNLCFPKQTMNEFFEVQTTFVKRTPSKYCLLLLQ